ncbi:PE-PGRS family protein [Streptomyces sp. SID4985]|uniref:PE-PGRS family protein n=1 Tax=Streptomyces sp. SID4985 TaxID=2690292 RepID=UPI001F259A37|nr:PE-PGRS family protein [Streptomyces sp. SID4985]
MTGGDVALTALLRRAGLEIAGQGRVREARPVSAAWRPVITGDRGPTVAVPSDHLDLVAEVNRQWHRLATEHAVVDTNGEFLISLAGQDCACCGHSRWMRVRLPEGAGRVDLAGLADPAGLANPANPADLAGLAGGSAAERGRPGFVAMSVDEQSVLGTTVEGDAVWLVSVDRFPAWLEASAKARAPESAEEREDGWDAVSRWTTASPRLRKEWLGGLAMNPAAPASVLRRLLDAGPADRVPYALIHRELPEEVVEAWIDHPEWRVRGSLAERWSLTAEQRARLLLDPDPHHRWIVLTTLADYGVTLPDATFDRLAADPSPRVRAELARLPALPARHLAKLAADPVTEVRLAAVVPAWPHLDAKAREALLADPDPGVRRQAVFRHHQSTPLSAADFDQLSSDGDRERAVETCVLDRNLAETLAHGSDSALRGALARNPHLSPDLVRLLAEDADPGIRWQISLRPDLTEEERSRIPVEFDPKARCRALSWVRELHDDEAAVRRLAISAHPLVRRSVACAKNLPTDVAERLARDEDFVVRLFLAENCAQAPAEVLLEMWASWNGYSAARMIEHPNFPRQDTLRYAEDTNPSLRTLALYDPDSTAELVERFSRDPDDGVRWRALRDERLSSASVVRLLDDPREWIRKSAAADPRVPARVLSPLLKEIDTAASAAQNPAIPEAVMHHLLDLVHGETE